MKELSYFSFRFPFSFTIIITQRHTWCKYLLDTPLRLRMRAGGRMPASRLLQGSTVDPLLLVYMACTSRSPHDEQETRTNRADACNDRQRPDLGSSTFALTLCIGMRQTLTKNAPNKVFNERKQSWSSSLYCELDRSSSTWLLEPTCLWTRDLSAIYLDAADLHDAKMNRRVNSAAVWASMFVVLMVAVESRPPVDVDETATTNNSDIVVIQPSPADRPLQRTYVWTPARAKLGRRRSPQPLPSSSVQLVGVDVRRVQRKPEVTTSDTGDDDVDDAGNSTSGATNVDATLDDQLHLARLRWDVCGYVSRDQLAVQICSEVHQLWRHISVGLLLQILRNSVTFYFVFMRHLCMIQVKFYLCLQQHAFLTVRCYYVYVV